MTDVDTISVHDVPGCVTPESAGTVVELHGDIDLATTELLEDCLTAGVERGGDVFVYLADVTLIDCASLGVLVEAGRVAERRGRTVHLVAPSSFVQHILAAAELGEVFPVIGDAPKMPAVA